MWSQLSQLLLGGCGYVTAPSSLSHLYSGTDHTLLPRLLWGGASHRSGKCSFILIRRWEAPTMNWTLVSGPRSTVPVLRDRITSWEQQPEKNFMRMSSMHYPHSGPLPFPSLLLCILMLKANAKKKKKKKRWSRERLSRASQTSLCQLYLPLLMDSALFSTPSSILWSSVNVNCTVLVQALYRVLRNQIT